MRTETDKIRANAADSAAQADAIDQQQDANVVEAINQLDSVVLPALEAARIGAQTASEELKKSLPQ